MSVISYIIIYVRYFQEQSACKRLFMKMILYHPNDLRNRVQNYIFTLK